MFRANMYSVTESIQYSRSDGASILIIIIIILSVPRSHFQFSWCPRHDVYNISLYLVQYSNSIWCLSLCV